MGTFPRVTHPSATKSEDFVRLACVKPAASVRSEPGSNSQVESRSSYTRINGKPHIEHPGHKGPKRSNVSFQKSRRTASSLRHPPAARKPQKDTRKDNADHASPSSFSTKSKSSGRTKRPTQTRTTETRPGQTGEQAPISRKSRQPRGPSREARYKPRSNPRQVGFSNFSGSRKTEKPKTFQGSRSRPRCLRPVIRSRGIGEGGLRRQSKNVIELNYFFRFAPKPCLRLHLLPHRS
jgi:hypothetical protein